MTFQFIGATYQVIVLKKMGKMFITSLMFIVKAWGNENNYPVLVVHGIQDNAGVFDRLIPLLPKDYYYFCIDLPGHGRSSHFPGYSMIHSFDFVFAYKVLLNYLKWEKCYFMGHSLGGQIAMRFAQLFPGYFEKIILLDCIYTIDITAHWYKGYYSDRINAVLRYHDSASKGQQPVYTFEKALEKIITNREFTEECAKIYLKRILVPVENGQYKFSMDPRLKYFLQPPGNLEQIVQLLKIYPIQCPVLVIVAKQNKMQLTYFKKVFKYVKTQKNFLLKSVDYGHDVHFTNPEVVAPFVCDFLSKKGKSKL